MKALLFYLTFFFLSFLSIVPLDAAQVARYSTQRQKKVINPRSQKSLIDNKHKVIKQYTPTQRRRPKHKDITKMRREGALQSRRQLREQLDSERMQNRRQSIRKERVKLLEERRKRIQKDHKKKQDKEQEVKQADKVRSMQGINEYQFRRSHSTQEGYKVETAGIEGSARMQDRVFDAKKTSLKDTSGIRAYRFNTDRYNSFNVYALD